MPQPTRAFTDGAGDVWLALDNGHRIRLPLKGTPGSGGGSAGADEVWIGPEPPDDPNIELWIDSEAENVVLDQGEADARYVNESGDNMTGNLDVRGTKVGLIWNGTTYYGMQSGTVAADGTGGPALLLGTTTNGENVYLIAKGAGVVALRPGNPTAAGTYDVKINTSGIDLPTTGSRLHWVANDMAIFADSGQFYLLDSTGNSVKPLYLGAPTNGNHAATKNYVDTRHGSVHFSIVERMTDVAIAKDAIYQIAFSTQSTDANQRSFAWNAGGQTIAYTGVYSGRLVVEVQHSVADGRMTVECTSSAGAGFAYGDRHGCGLANSWYRFSTSFTRSFNAGDLIGGRVIAHDGAVTLGIAQMSLAGPFASAVP